MNTSEKLDSIADRLQGWLDDQVIRYERDGIGNLISDGLPISNPLISRGDIKEMIWILSEAGFQLDNQVSPKDD